MVTDLLRSLGLFNHEDKNVRKLASNFMDMWHNLDTRADLYMQLSQTRFDMQEGNRTVTPVDESATGKNEYLKRSYTQIVKTKSKGLMYEEPEIGVHEIIVNARNVRSLIPDSRFNKLMENFTVQQILKQLMNPRRELGEIEKLRVEKMNGNEFHDNVLSQVLDEYDAIKALDIGDDYIFHKQPNLMQRYTAWKMKHVNGFFNMSRTGTGKSNASIMATRVTNSKFTMILSPFSIINQWEDTINECYDKQMITKGVDLFDNYLTW